MVPLFDGQVVLDQPYQTIPLSSTWRLIDPPAVPPSILTCCVHLFRLLDDGIPHGLGGARYYVNRAPPLHSVGPLRRGEHVFHTAPILQTLDTLDLPLRALIECVLSIARIRPGSRSRRVKAYVPFELETPSLSHHDGIVRVATFSVPRTPCSQQIPEYVLKRAGPEYKVHCSLHLRRRFFS